MTVAIVVLSICVLCLLIAFAFVITLSSQRVADWKESRNRAFRWSGDWEVKYRRERKRANYHRARCRDLRAKLRTLKTGEVARVSLDNLPRREPKFTFDNEGSSES